MTLFANLIGHQEIKSYLEKMIQAQSIPNTILFWGPNGVGKKTFAIRLASYLLKRQKPDAQDTRVDTNNHPDFHFLEPEGKTGMHAIHSIRDLISQVNMAPFEASAKVFMIDEADRMLAYSSNALLKTLEEPTLDSYIILITNKIENLIPTIVSRCCKIEFFPLKEQDLEAYMSQVLKKEKNELASLIKEANGSIGKIHDLIFNEKYIKRKKLIISVLDGLQNKPYWQIVNDLTELESLIENNDELAVKKHQEIEEIFLLIEMWYRDLHILKMGLEERHLFFQHEADILKKQLLAKVASFEKVKLLLDEAKNAVQRNIKIKYCLEYVLLTAREIA